MHARDIIDRLASLDEVETAEPVVEPEIETPVETPRRRSAPDPWQMPPDMEPGGEPRPKAQDDTGAIESWLEMTQQPVSDWDWDGEELRLLLDDGTTEVYNRGQLEEIGVFAGEMAFAESVEDDKELPVSPEADWLDDNDKGLPPMPADDQAINDFASTDEPVVPDEAAGVLDQILGRTPGGAPSGQAPAEVQVIQIDGDAATEVLGAVSDIVQAILGVTGDKEEDTSKDKEGDKKADKEEDDTGDNSKSDKEKPKDKEDDKKADKKSDNDE